MNEIEQQRVINRMTNWQRHQWAKSGYKKRDILKFANMVRQPDAIRVLESIKRMQIKMGLGR